MTSHRSALTNNFTFCNIRQEKCTPKIMNKKFHYKFTSEHYVHMIQRGGYMNVCVCMFVYIYIYICYYFIGIYIRLSRKYMNIV